MYNIERGHHFNEIQKHLVKIKELRGPVYDPVEFRHHYDTIQALGEKLLNLQVRETSYWSSDEFDNKQLINYCEFCATVSLVYYQGPIYEIDRQHNYQDLGPLVDKIKALQGPVYNIDANHHYQQILDHVDNLKSLKGPVYDIDRYALKDYFTTFL